MAEAIVSFVAERIGGFLIDEANFLLKVSDQVEDLQKNLKEILCLLKDADSRQIEDHTVRNWVSEIREIAYDAEDVTETYILKVRDAKFHKKVANYLSGRVHRFGSDIEKINSRIPDLTEKMLKYGITHNNPPEPRKRSPKKRMEYAHIEEDYVGMEDYVNEVVAELIDENKQHRVVSLWGMGGLGKTSLARKTYTDKRVRDHFEFFSWVCVSQEYQVESILREILKSFDPKKGETATDDELHQSLYKFQQENKCLVILDDIWTDDAWEGLKAAFPIRKSLGRILITTRNKDIARHMDPHSFICSLRCLTEEEGWELMKRRAFLDTHGLMISKDMESLGRRIVEQCGYLPLAIIVTGGVLANKTTVEEWEVVHQNIHSHLRKGNNDLLDLSYNDLPYHLKPCFLYMANFPEDYWISAKSLIRMWIAEGFVTEYDDKRGESILDVAESYVNELVDRGMVQARAKTLSTEVGFCRLHDLIRDLSIRKAKEENFSDYVRIDTSSSGLSLFDNCKARRLSIYMTRYPQERDQRELERSTHFRSFICNVGYHELKDIQCPIHLVSNCRLLRVLDLVSQVWQEVIMPESVGDLIHLRHFRLTRFKMERLPSTMESLVLLETFDLNCSYFANLSFLPHVLRKMKRLRELCLPPCLISNSKSTKKIKFDFLERLEILKNFSFRICEVKDLHKLKRLRKLMFFSEETNECEGFEIFSLLDEINFKQLQHACFTFWKPDGHLYPESKLRQLVLYKGSCKLYLGGKIQMLPEFPYLLKKLDLLDSELEEDPMPVLEKLANLISLRLYDNSFLGKEMVCSRGGFPQLKSLSLRSLKNLEEIKFAEGSMTCLSELFVRKCEKLKMVPEGLDFIASHQKLDFVYYDKDDQRFQVVKEEQGWIFRRGEYNPIV